MENFKLALLDFAKNVGTNILEAIALLLFGILVIKIARRVLTSLLHRTKLEGSAASFIISLAQAALALVLFFLLMSIFKIDTSSIVAIVAASGLAIGLALQDSLSNVSSGIILLFTKPFKENDLIVIGSVEGYVKRIKITTTELLTGDNTLLSIPNAKVITSDIINYSTRPTRRIDIVASAAYDSDIDKVKSSLLDMLDSDERILSNPAPEVFICKLNNSSVDYNVRFWVNTSSYWNVYNSYNEQILRAFQKADIAIPFDHLDVAVIRNKEGN